MNAANMIHEGHLRSAYMLAQGFLLSSRDMEDVDIDARHNGLLPDLLPYAMARLSSCRDPLDDPLGECHNTIQSLNAIPSHGAAGLGMYVGNRKKGPAFL